MLPKTLETKKLFYRKYPFKVCCLVTGGRFVTQYGSHAVSHAMAWDKKYGRDGFSRNGRIDPNELDTFLNAVLPFLDNDSIKIRTEGKHFNLFCVDKATYNNILTRLGKWVYEMSEPKTDKDLEYLLNNQAIKVLVDQLPHEKYHYKIVLKSTLKSEARTKLLGWIRKYAEDDIYVSSPSTLDWLYGKKPYIQDPFIYVGSDQIRTLMELYLGNNKSRTEEYVIRSTL